MAPHTLFYTPGACSLSPHIALREARLTFELSKVDLRSKKLADGGDWLAINPKGYVPALRLPDGNVLTEGAVMVQYIADQRPEAQLAPAAGTFERYRLMETLNFLATELHKGASPLYNPAIGDDYRKSLLARLGTRFAWFAGSLAGKQFVMGDQFTIADGYAFYCLHSWQHAHKQDLARWSELADYYHRLASRPTIAAALEAEGLPA
jgi:glutathione S-transferase